MGWGEAPRQTPERSVEAADRLAEAVLAWESHPTTGNADLVTAARRDYERTRGRLR